MCGISGVASTSMMEFEMEWARRLTIMNFLRGEDSTGMMDYCPTAKKDEKVLYWQTLDHPVEFAIDVMKDKIANRWKLHQPKIIATHCRAATQGKIIKANSHPFLHGNILGMHNGTITKDFENRKKFGTDSEAIVYNINKMGIKGALKELNDKDPAYALVWFDLKDWTLNFIRNMKRPLYYCFTSAKGTLAWSSEKEHLEFVIKGTGGTTIQRDIRMFLCHTHYKVPMFPKNSFEMEDAFLKEAEEGTRTTIVPFHGTTTILPEKSSTSSGGSAVSTTGQYSETHKSFIEGKLDVFKSPFVAGRIPAVREFMNQDPKARLEYFLSKGKPGPSKVHCLQDNITKLYFTQYYYDCVTISRNNAILARDNIKVSPKSEEIPFNDSIPFAETDEQDRVEIYYPHGTSNMLVTEQELLEHLKVGCCCCGNVTENADEFIFWVDNESTYICQECSENILTDETHWVHTIGYIAENAVNRLREEYQSFHDVDSPAEEKVA